MKTVSLLPKLGISIGFLFLFFPEISLHHHAHNTPTQILFLAISFFFSLFYFLQVIKYTKFHTTAFLILILFTFLHVLPLGTTAKYHHQSTDSSSLEHPCCMPQTAHKIPSIVKVSFVTTVEQLVEVAKTTTPHIFISSLHNKSPPSVA